MGDYRIGSCLGNRGETLNSLKEQLHSLNMRLLLAMQDHNEEAQEQIRGQMAEVQAAIDRMCAGNHRR